jgi:hypothetical protein
LVEEGGAQATTFACLPNDRVHLPIDPDASVAGAFEWFLREPMVAIAPPKDLNKTVSEF